MHPDRRHDAEPARRSPAASWRIGALGACLGLLLQVGLLSACGSDGNGPSRPHPALSAPSGFSADTRTPAGLVGGARASEAACRALPDAVWARAGRRGECLRYAILGAGRLDRTAVVFIPGDPPGASYDAAGRIWPDVESDEPATQPALRSPLSSLVEAGLPNGTAYLVVARPGMGGSSGQHARDRHTIAEVRLIDDALSQLKRRYRFDDFALAGFSSGGAVVANLLPLRTDIRCAALDSAPLDLLAFYRRPDGTLPDHVAMRADLADPMHALRGLRTNAMVWVVGDPGDRNVPPASWLVWAGKARQDGVSVITGSYAAPRRAASFGDAHHHDRGLALRLALACADRAPP